MQTKIWKNQATKASIIILILALCPSISATSDCLAGAGYPIVCTCDNNQVEKYYSSESFKEAREDPTSCCYVKPKDVIINSKSIYGTYKPQPIIKESKPVVEVSKPILEEEPNYNQINDILADRLNQRTTYKGETIEIEEEPKPILTTSDIRSLFLFVFQPLLPTQYHRSNFLSF